MIVTVQESSVNVAPSPGVTTGAATVFCCQIAYNTTVAFAVAVRLLTICRSE